MCTNVSPRRESVNPAEVNEEVPSAETAGPRRHPCAVGTAAGRRYRSPMRLNISSIVA